MLLCFNDADYWRFFQIKIQNHKKIVAPYEVWFMEVTSLYNKSSIIELQHLFTQLYIASQYARSTELRCCPKLQWHVH